MLYRKLACHARTLPRHPLSQDYTPPMAKLTRQIIQMVTVCLLSRHAQISNALSLGEDGVCLWSCFVLSQTHSTNVCLILLSGEVDKDQFLAYLVRGKCAQTSRASHHGDHFGMTQDK
eukprot:6455828-Amphidinium_carterae.1